MSRLRLALASVSLRHPNVSGNRAPIPPVCALGIVCFFLLEGLCSAQAAPMDAALGGLLLNAGCSAPSGRPCEPDGGGFARLVAQYGAAAMPPWAVPARTLGSRGLRMGLQRSRTSIDRQASYWLRGTRAGQQDPRRLESSLGLYAFTVSKGLGFGLDASALAGWLSGTGLALFGGRLQLAPLEGWDVGRYAWLPDVALALSGWGSTGRSDLSFSGMDYEVRFSKPLPVAADLSVSPWFGLSRLALRGKGRRVDLTPNEDALSDCVYRGPALPGTTSRSGQLPPLDGSPLCAVGDARAFDDSVDFGEARVLRHRLLLGLSLRVRQLAAAVQLGFEPRSPAASQSSSSMRRALNCEGAVAGCSISRRQWSWVLSLALGL